MRRLLAITALAFSLAAGADAELPPPPEQFLGHRVGADHKLAPWPRVLEYLRLVDEASDRVAIESAGSSTLGNEMPLVILTSPANHQRLDRWRDVARQLANPDRLAPEAAGQLIAEGKAIALVTCTIHSTEVGSTQMAMEFVWQFATTEDPERKAWMEDVVLLLMPSINPDGQVMVIDWYERYLGTEFEGGRMPWLYHHYVGHDNNRDFYMLTQKETRAVNRVLYHRWFPQVFLDEHQMGSLGPRMFVPPQTDPLDPEIHSLIFRQADVIGTNMSFRLEEAGKTGVGHNMIYDSYWPGGTRNTAWWKNVTGLLTEVASARIASPIRIEPGELRGGYKGLPEYARRANFPSPWPGGWWRLRDIVDYELIATWAYLEAVAENRREILRNFHRMGAAAVTAGRDGSPAAWIVEPEQHDPVAAGRLVELLIEHGVRVYAAEAPFTIGRTSYPAGTAVIPAAQPYRPFLLTMLRPQRYPEVTPYAGGPVIPPYDVTSWSLPISMGVELSEVDAPLPAALTPLDQPVWPQAGVAAAAGGHRVPHAADSVYVLVNRLLARGGELYWLTGAAQGGAAGDLWIPPGAVDPAELERLAGELHLPVAPLDAAPEGSRWRLAAARVGLYKPWVASMDEGWTRFLLERYEFPFVNLHNADFADGGFRSRVDVVLFPDVDRSIIADGKPDFPNAERFVSPLPPEYAGGIGAEGGEQLREWVEQGGTVVALDSSCAYLIDLLALPLSDALANGEEVEAPGTMVRLLVDTDHPLGYGLRREEAAYFAGSPAFRTTVPDARYERHVVARYPDHRDDIPLSGYIRGADRLTRLAAVVEMRVGRGRVVLIGFRAQHRAQPLRTFKLLFNALYRLTAGQAD